MARGCVARYTGQGLESHSENAQIRPAKISSVDGNERIVDVRTIRLEGVTDQDECYPMQGDRKRQGGVVYSMSGLGGGERRV